VRPVSGVCHATLELRRASSPLRFSSPHFWLSYAQHNSTLERLALTQIELNLVALRGADETWSVPLLQFIRLSAGIDCTCWRPAAHLAPSDRSPTRFARLSLRINLPFLCDSTFALIRSLCSPKRLRFSNPHLAELDAIIIAELVKVGADHFCTSNFCTSRLSRFVFTAPNVEIRFVLSVLAAACPVLISSALLRLQANKVLQKLEFPKNNIKSVGGMAFGEALKVRPLPSVACGC
jgi:hypothetical protein